MSSILLTMSFIFLGVSLLLWITLAIFGHKNIEKLEIVFKNPRFAILIPARDESKVIEDLLKSIKKQTRAINMEDVYVIIEEKKDPTAIICQKYNASVIIRKHLEKKTKGYALEEGIKHLIRNNKYYDAYFMFDADNILDSHYIEEMEKDYQKGYAISTGYRNLKNGSDNALASASGLTYWIINEWMNKKAINKSQNILLSGTGFYLHGKYIKKWETYPFHSLTEDVELSSYATLHGLSTHYNEKAIFYDEQPTKFHQSILQRKRWIRGFFQNWFHYFPEYLKKLTEQPNNRGSILHMMFDIPMLLFFLLGIIFLIIDIGLSSKISVLYLGALLYFLLVALTCLIYLKDNGKLKINEKTKYKSIWYHPIYLASYIYAFLLTLIQKDIGWDKINHGKK